LQILSWRKEWYFRGGSRVGFGAGFDVNNENRAKWAMAVDMYFLDSSQEVKVGVVVLPFLRFKIAREEGWKENSPAGLLPLFNRMGFLSIGGYKLS
jgi:hypothetical protein